MPKPDSFPRRPSDDLEILAQQLLRALATLEEEGEAGEPALYEVYLGHAQALAWQGVFRRRPQEPRVILDHLLAVQPFIDEYLERPAGARAAAALDLHFGLQSLYLADRALAPARSEARLSNRDRSLVEREILRVLLANRQRFLRRGEVQRQLRLLRRPTSSRVGQVLVGLDYENLVVRTPGRTQGNPQASFYALSPQGVDLCRRLGLDHGRSPYFRLEEEAWRSYSVPSRVRVPPDSGAAEPRRVTAFWSDRGGVGRTAVVAQAAKHLAASGRGTVLVIDLDLDSPGLDARMAPAGIGRCRGLRGLIVDFHQVPAGERSSWLRESLRRPEYVLRPASDRLPDLHYLPSGFAPGTAAGLDEERAEALSHFQAEARRCLGEPGAPDGSAGPGFLQELRVCLHEDLFARTLIDPHAGLGLTAWAAVLQLSDALVLCSRRPESEPAMLRAGLGNFLRQRAEEAKEKVSFVAFLFTDLPAGAESDLEGWVERNLLQATERAAGPYRLAVLSESTLAASWVGIFEGAVWSRERSPALQYRECINMAISPDVPWRSGIARGLLLNSRDPQKMVSVLADEVARSQDAERRSALVQLLAELLLARQAKASAFSLEPMPLATRQAPAESYGLGPPALV